jgi:hypothetical protein
LGGPQTAGLLRTSLQRFPTVLLGGSTCTETLIGTIPAVDTQAAGPESPNVTEVPPQAGAQLQSLTPRPGHFGSEPENAVDLGLLDELTTGLSEVQDALARLDNGSYGHCEHCGQEIDDAMLESSPTARLCAAHLPFGNPGDQGSGEPRQQA